LIAPGALSFLANRQTNCIDTLVENEHKNIRANDSGQKVIILPAEGNPVTLVNDELKKAGYGEIHLYMLTKPGSIIFDEINIIPDNIEEYASDFREWKGKLKQDSKIFIHSADLTSVPEGLTIIQKIREYTGCEVIVWNSQKSLINEIQFSFSTFLIFTDFAISQPLKQLTPGQ
jgi:hypothetical protein